MLYKKEEEKFEDTYCFLENEVQDWLDCATARQCKAFNDNIQGTSLEMG